MLGSKPTILPVLAAIASAQDYRGHYTVSSLGSRKQAVISAGGNSLDLAIAMLETENMGSDYAYGDSKQLGAANFGIPKQNWGMLRVCASSADFVGQSEQDWNNGAILNDDLNTDVTSRAECQEHYGYDLWFAGHRNGDSDLQNPNTPDTGKYKSAVEWFQKQLDSDPVYESDDTRFWVDVTPI